VVVLVAGAKVGPITGNSTRAPVLAVVVLAVRALGEGDGAQAKKQNKKSPAIHGGIICKSKIEVI